jgi:hypothetical protein
VVGVFKQALQGCVQVNKSSWRKYLIEFVEFIREEWTVGIPRGDFATSHESSDLGNMQGSYDDVFPKGLKLRRGGAIDQDHKGRWIHTCIVGRGFIGRTSKILQQRLRYHKTRYPDGRVVWDHNRISGGQVAHHIGIQRKQSPET